MAIALDGSRVEIRLYNAASTGYRVIPRQILAPGLYASITASEGYGEGALNLYGVRSKITGLERDRYVEFWAIYKSRIDGSIKKEPLYRGQIKRIMDTRDSGRRIVQLRLFGIWAEAAKRICYKRYANSAQDDRYRLFNDLFFRFVRTGRLAALDLDSRPVGDVLDYLDADEIDFGSAVDMLRQNVGRIVTGADVNWDVARTPDRLLFRPYEDLADPLTVPHVLHLPGRQIGSRSRETDSTGQATILRIRGGQLGKGRANLLAGAVDGNTSFEYPELAGDSPAGNLLENGGFEAGTGDDANEWTRSGGATAETGSANNVTPFEGQRYMELDSIGEMASQTKYAPFDPPPVAVVVGDKYIVDCRCRLREAEHGASGELRLIWLDSSGADIGSPVVAPLTPGNTDGYSGIDFSRLFSAVSFAPSGATGLRVEMELTDQDTIGDDSCALLVDAVRVYSANGTTQKGWGLRVEGDAQFNAVRWDEDSTSWHKGRCVYLDVTAYDDGAREAHLEPLALNRVAIVGGQNVIGGFAIKKAPGSPDVLLKVEVAEWKNDNTLDGISDTTYTLSSEDWIILTSTRALGEDGAQATVYLTFRSAGQVYVDGAFLFDAGAPSVDVTKPGEFIEADRFAITLGALDLFADGTDIHEAAEELGEITAVEDRSEITTREDAVSYATAFFERYVLDLERPEITTYGVVETGRGSTASMWPGEAVRAIGPDAGDTLPAPLPLVEKLIKTEKGKLVIVLNPNAEPRDPARAIRDIVRKERRQGLLSTGGSSSYAGTVT